MISKYIFAFVFAIFALYQSQARPGLENENMRCYYDCDVVDPTLKEVVDSLLQDGFVKYDNDYCRVAQYVSDELKSLFEENYLVLIGAHKVMENRKRFAAQFDKVKGNYLVFSYKETHDVLVVKPLCEQPNLPQKSGKFSAGSARDLTQINTTMSTLLKIRFQSNVNTIFENTKGDYDETAKQALSYAKSTCGGKWFVLVGPELVLTNSRLLCGVAKKYDGTTFNATYEYSDSINLYAPICN